MKKKRITIAFLGTDGSGKSTIIEAITPDIQYATGMRVRYEHLRPNYIPSLGAALGKRTKEEEECHNPVANPHASTPSGFIGSLIRLLYYLIDYTYGYFRKIYPSKDAVWIFDRYYPDFLIDQRRARLSLPNWVIRIMGIFVPEPDCYLCLGGDPQVIFKRKPETSLEEVVRQNNMLNRFCKKKEKAYWINTTQSIEDSISDVMRIVKQILLKQ